MIERMADFFDARVEGYEQHMLEHVGSAHEFYKETARCFPVMKEMNLLDLGCGTGLELDRLFPIMPDLMVTGVDMSDKMLDKLREKYPDKEMNLIQANYLEASLPAEHFDAAVAVQTMHHFRSGEKLHLYQKILTALKPGGLLVCDTVLATGPRNASVVKAARKLGNAAQASPHRKDLMAWLMAAGFDVTSVGAFSAGKVDPELDADGNPTVPLAPSDEPVSFVATSVRIYKADNIDRHINKLRDDISQFR